MQDLRYWGSEGARFQKILSLVGQRVPCAGGASPDGLAGGELGVDQLHNDADGAPEAAAHGRGNGAAGNHLHAAGHMSMHVGNLVHMSCVMMPLVCPKAPRIVVEMAQRATTGMRQATCICMCPCMGDLALGAHGTDGKHAIG